MDQCTHEVRLQYWKNIISQCRARPEGQSAKQWLKANGICEQTYYLWQRRIRKELYAQMSSSQKLPAVTPVKEEITFAELPLPKPDMHPLPEADQTIHPVAIIKAGACSIALSKDIPEDMLSLLLKEVLHA